MPLHRTLCKSFCLKNSQNIDFFSRHGSIGACMPSMLLRIHVDGFLVEGFGAEPFAVVAHIWAEGLCLTVRRKRPVIVTYNKLITENKFKNTQLI